MGSQIFKWMSKKYPQNFILQKPYIGTLIYVVCCFGFVVLYKPFNEHASRFSSFAVTMAIYFCSVAIPVFLIITFLKSFRYFSDPNTWTFLKEILSIVMILLGMGIVIYFIGFIMEPPADRWNLSTLLDSCKQASLIGIIPLLFFAGINYRYLFVTDVVKNYAPDNHLGSAEQTEALLQINSRLKKEELSFYPGQFVYAESDGNYVVFHLNVNQQIQKKIIRNSINNIEHQLKIIPYLIRIHRAYIVNAKEVVSQKGNTLGYRLKLTGIDIEIPVSRQKTRVFDECLRQYR
jgi:hypothetical protein